MAKTGNAGMVFVSNRGDASDSPLRGQRDPADRLEEDGAGDSMLDTVIARIEQMEFSLAGALAQPKDRTHALSQIASRIDLLEAAMQDRAAPVDDGRAVLEALAEIGAQLDRVGPDITDAIAQHVATPTSQVPALADA
ncbi:MAG: hypothetical protein AAF914_12810, partial [Pseudomonadota bacterium]